MAIFVADGLPAIDILASEGIKLHACREFPEEALRIGVLNLMPLKADTETDLLRAFSDSERDLAFRWFTPASHHCRNTSKQHINRFYCHLTPDGSMKWLDALIVTGAPIEKLQYGDVDYWMEFCNIVDAAADRGIPVMLLCWAAFAGLYHRFGINKTILENKISGVYPHKIHERNHPLVNGIETDMIYAPQSRFVTIDTLAATRTSGLHIIASNATTGIHIAATDSANEIYITGHGEYAIDTLHKEFLRDKSRGLNPSVPCNYYAGNHPDNSVINSWQACGRRIFSNWIKAIVSPASEQKQATDYQRQAPEQ